VRFSAPCRSTARPAPLEQLPAIGRELEGGILAVDTGGSRWLIDRARRCFQRIDPEMDVARAITFGSWEPFAEVTCDDADNLVVVPAGSGTALRARLATP